MKKNLLVISIFVLCINLIWAAGAVDSNVTLDWADNSPNNNVEPDYDIVFNQSEVLEFNIVIDSENWQAMQDDLEENLSTDNTDVIGSRGNRPIPGDEPGENRPPPGKRPVGNGSVSVGPPRDQDGHGMPGEPQATVTGISFDPIWVPASVTFDDMNWEHVGIRFKGNSSLTSAVSSDHKKLSFKLDFDEFEDEYPETKNQTFYGFRQLNLNNNFSDESLMREKVSADLFREFGLVSAQTSFCIVNVDYGEGSQYFGLYTLVEEMDDTVLETQLGDDSGNLYKPDGSAASFAFGKYNDDEMVKKNNEDEADYSDVQKLYEVLNSEYREKDAVSWKSDLEAVFNIDGFLKWLAANTVIQNWDTYGNSTRNYYLYNNPETGLLNWIPWDNNESLQDGKSRLFSLSLAEVDNGWPLIRYLLDDAEYKAEYDSYVQNFVDEVFSRDKMIETYNGYFEMIKECAYNEVSGYTFIRSDQSFNSAVEDLKSHVVQRNEAVVKYLKN